ncbi:hypothetical protein [Dishui Lake phycodnavirus 2]|nr:hypothetical protein [Dishui Lake phycodnavirus 2]
MRVAFVLFLILVATALMWRCEKYMMDSRVDTNPMRRRSQFFDTCSPENWEDCELSNDPFAGLPLP